MEHFNEAARRMKFLSLKILIDMILKGSSVNKETAANTPDIVPKEASLTIAQLLMFNSISYARDRKEPSNTHHTREKECPSQFMQL